MNLRLLSDAWCYITVPLLDYNSERSAFALDLSFSKSATVNPFQFVLLLYIYLHYFRPWLEKMGLSLWGFRAVQGWMATGAVLTLRIVKRLYKFCLPLGPCFGWSDRIIDKSQGFLWQCSICSSRYAGAVLTHRYYYVYHLFPWGWGFRLDDYTSMRKPCSWPNYWTICGSIKSCSKPSGEHSVHLFWRPRHCNRMCWFLLHSCGLK